MCIRDRIESIGSNVIFIGKFGPMVGRMSPEVLNRKDLTIEDAEAIKELPLVQAVAPLLQRNQFATSARQYVIKYKDRTARNTIMQGVTPITIPRIVSSDLSLFLIRESSASAKVSFIT